VSVSDFQLGAPLSEVGNPGPERLDQGDFEWPALEWADRGLIVTGMIARRRGRHRDPGVAETSGGRAVRVVLDPQDCGRCTRVLTELHHLGAGRVVCHPRPGGARAQLGADLLVALGKRHDALELEHLGSRGWALAAMWLRAERIAHLVVLRAHQLGAWLLG
jgi:hypothetical protein